MVDTKLILIDGVAGSGKSTLAQRLYRCLHLAGIASDFFHEFFLPHPMGAGTCSDPPQWIDQTVAKWRRFAKAREAADRVSVFDGVLSQVAVGELLEANLPEPIILEFLERVEKIVSPLQPRLIHLCQEDVEAAIRRLWDQRPESWCRRVVNTMEHSPYGRQSGLLGRDLYIDFVTRQRAVINRAFDRSRMEKTEINSSDRDWDSVLTDLCLFLDQDRMPDVVDSGKYCGRYTDSESGRVCEIALVSGSLTVVDLFKIPKTLLQKDRETMFVGGWPDELTFSRDESDHIAGFRSTGSWNRVGTGEWIRVDDQTYRCA